MSEKLNGARQGRHAWRSRSRGGSRFLCLWTPRPALSERGDPISPRLWCLLLPRFHASSLQFLTHPPCNKPTCPPTHTHTRSCLLLTGNPTQGCIWRWMHGREPEYLTEWLHVEKIQDKVDNRLETEGATGFTSKQNIYWRSRTRTENSLLKFKSHNLSLTWRSDIICGEKEFCRMSPCKDPYLDQDLLLNELRLFSSQCKTTNQSFSFCSYCVWKLAHNLPYKAKKKFAQTSFLLIISSYSSYVVMQLPLLSHGRRPRWVKHQGCCGSSWKGSLLLFLFFCPWASSKCKNFDRVLVIKTVMWT